MEISEIIGAGNFSNFIDNAYKCGAGRYIQEKNAISQLSKEVLRLGSKPMVIYGPNSHDVALPLIEQALTRANIEYTQFEFCLPSNVESVEEFAGICKNEKCDVVVGLGGGRILDFAKAVAAKSQASIICVPTSAATCSAYTPLSVMYEKSGKFAGTWRYVKDIDCVIVDDKIMKSQPARLLAAGILDSIAKVPELLHETSGLDIDNDNFDIQRYVAYKYAEVSNEILFKFGKTAYGQLQGTDDVFDSEIQDRVVFTNIALTGIVSSIMKGFHQTALAHKFYDGLRSVYTDEVKEYYHGELVAIGLLMQTNFNENKEMHDKIKALMIDMNMPISLGNLGINRSESRIVELYDFINIDEFVDKDAVSQIKLKNAFESVF